MSWFSDFVFRLNADISLTALLADGDIFHFTDNLTTIALIRFHDLWIAECNTSAAFFKLNRGNDARF